MVATRKIIYASVIITVIGILLKVWLFDVLVRFGIRDQTALRKRNEVRGIYLKIPFPLNFKLYFFNVTNPQEVQTGAKPIVREMGPYWYDEFKEKIDIVDNETEDSLTYTPYDIFQFNENKSKPLTDDDYVTIINPVLVGMVNFVLRDSPVFLSIVNKSLSYIFNDPKTIFLTVKVKDLLFDGVELNCTSKEFSVTAICSQLKGQIPGIKFRKDNANVYLFSLLGSKNGTIPKRLKVLRGISDSSDLGKLIELDGKRQIDLWSSDKCNRFNGTDGWIFPPLRKIDEGFQTFSTDLCRNVRLNYINDTIYKNLNARYYESNLGDQTNNESEKCYCPSKDTCLKKGLFDLTKCMGVPLYATLPHFLHTDPSYLKQIDGLEPDVSKHSLMAYFEPMTSTPLLATKRLQLNFDLHPTPKVALFSKLPNALFPVLWLEESVDLDGYLLKKIQTTFLLLHIADIILYVIIVAGFGFLGVGLHFHLKNRKKVTIITTPLPEKVVRNLHDNNNIKHLTRRGEGEEKLGNQVLRGHEFDRY